MQSSPHNTGPSPSSSSFFTLKMFHSSKPRSKSKSHQPGPTMIPDFPPTQGPVYYPPSPPPKKKKHNYSWAPFETSSNSSRFRPNPTPHVRFTPDTLDREREREKLFHRNSFADYFSWSTTHHRDPPRRYREYRNNEGYFSTLVDPEIQRLGREHREYRNDEGYVSTLVDPEIQRLGREHREHQRHESHRHRRYSTPAAPVQEDARWPESIYYLGTENSPPLFLSERESRYRKHRERGLKEFIEEHGGRGGGAGQSRYEYLERKSLPPGKGLKRMKSFFRGEEEW